MLRHKMEQIEKKETFYYLPLSIDPSLFFDLFSPLLFFAFTFLSSSFAAFLHLLPLYRNILPDGCQSSQWGAWQRKLWWSSSLPICCAICFETPPPSEHLLSSCVTLENIPQWGSKHFHLSFSDSFGSSLRIKWTLCSWPELRFRTLALLGFTRDFLFSQWVAWALNLGGIS